MDMFDRKIRRMAKAENTEVPQAVHNKVCETLSSLPENEFKLHNISLFRRITAIAASFILVFIFLLPNLSPAYAEALSQIPVLGDIIKVVTIRNYKYYGNQHEMDIAVPQIENAAESGESINKDINELTETLVREFYAKIGTDAEEGSGAIYLDYEIVTDNPDWFTLKINVVELSGSSDSYFRYYHIDKNNGKITNLGDLFTDDEGIRIVCDEIKRQMAEKTALNPDMVFWTDEEEFSESFSILPDDHNFYWNREDNLVIPFDKYEIGPGSSGNPEFMIEKSLLNPYLKPEYKGK